MTALELKLDLGDDFFTTLDEMLNEEVEIAQDKWAVALTEDEKATVLKNAKIQLVNRVNSFSRNPWDYTQNLAYNVNGAAGSFTLPSTKANKSNLAFTRTSDSWIVDSDGTADDPVLLKDFLNVIKEEFITWGRTGVFYGVASYKK